LNLIGLVILTIWHVPESALWFAFMTMYSAVLMSSVQYGWINSLLNYSPAKWSIVLILAKTLAQSMTAWVLLLAFNTVEALRFRKEYSYVLANSLCLIVLADIIYFYVKRRHR
jgi:hypothetical protein